MAINYTQIDHSEAYNAERLKAYKMARLIAASRPNTHSFQPLQMIIGKTVYSGVRYQSGALLMIRLLGELPASYKRSRKTIYTNGASKFVIAGAIVLADSPVFELWQIESGAYCPNFVEDHINDASMIMNVTTRLFQPMIVSRKQFAVMPLFQAQTLVRSIPHQNIAQEFFSFTPHNDGTATVYRNNRQ